MTETQREPVPQNDESELDTALAFLTFARESLLKKADGLDDEQLRRVLVDTGTNVLGLVQHMTVGERYRFGFHRDAIADSRHAGHADILREQIDGTTGR